MTFHVRSTGILCVHRHYDSIFKININKKLSVFYTPSFMALPLAAITNKRCCNIDIFKFYFFVKKVF